MLLELRNVTKDYPLRPRRTSLFKKTPRFKAVNQVDLTIKKGEIVGLVGESGSGKSTLAKLIMNIEPVTSGKILLNGQPVHGKRMSDLTLYKQMQLVLQDSSSSLHPNMRVKELLEEPLRNYLRQEKTMREATIRKLLKLVGLSPPFLSRYPHQLSGGQKQRVCIAKALAVQPDIILFDESIASLDHPSQMEILHMLKHIQKQQQLSYLFITHDLKSVQQLCDRVAVMYQGELVETFSRWDPDQLRHPYSRLLFQTLN
ncbi:ABC transporter ATP-binding protein [Bacillus thermotolerans]|uniref:ABC transporter ATP-binding protein n=1 Tax=Bacillus thermotolerans TaxID=1221996 RepID=UPI00057F93C0|nr:dipeptide/oligopeptide/nickel ABC transporter ATP-binding protein [Bacillus thermotolerans]KKB37801.1 Oligopeptide transport ATP-binding protein OppF [Bacillus thermotolerans]